MPERNSRKTNDKTFRQGLAPDGSGGLGSHGVNLTPNAMLTAFELVRAERVRVHRGVLERAPGTRRLAVLTNNTGSRTFGADGKYALWPAPLIPAGGWGFYLHFGADALPAAGSANTAFIVGSRPAGQAYHVFKVTILDGGVGPSGQTVAFSVVWRDSGGATRTVTWDTLVSAITNPSYHLFGIYIPESGTFTVYLNGSSVGTPLTGLAATLKPAQDSGVIWSFGVEKETAAAVTANTHFDGKTDAFTLFSFPGVRASAGSPSLFDTLLAHSFREWPNPAMPIVIAHFDFSETSGTTLYDRSRKKNAATLTGASTATAAVALSYPVGNYAGVFQKANGQKANLVAAGGSLYFETIRSS